MNTLTYSEFEQVVEYLQYWTGSFCSQKLSASSVALRGKIF